MIEVTIPGNSLQLDPYIKDCCRNKENRREVRNEMGYLVAYQCAVCHIRQAVGYLTY